MNSRVYLSKDEFFELHAMLGKCFFVFLNISVDFSHLIDGFPCLPKEFIVRFDLDM